MSRPGIDTKKKAQPRTSLTSSELETTHSLIGALFWLPVSLFSGKEITILVQSKLACKRKASAGSAGPDFMSLST